MTISGPRLFWIVGDKIWARCPFYQVGWSVKMGD